jgi:hypothetical protein
MGMFLERRSKKLYSIPKGSLHWTSRADLKVPFV